MLLWWTTYLPVFPFRTLGLPYVAAEFNPSPERQLLFHPGGDARAKKPEPRRAGNKETMAAAAEANETHPLGGEKQRQEVQNTGGDVFISDFGFRVVGLRFPCVWLECTKYDLLFLALRFLPFSNWNIGSGFGFQCPCVEYSGFRFSCCVSVFGFDQKKCVESTPVVTSRIMGGGFHAMILAAYMQNPNYSNYWLQISLVGYPRWNLAATYFVCEMPLISTCYQVYWVKCLV